MRTALALMLAAAATGAAGCASAPGSVWSFREYVNWFTGTPIVSAASPLINVGSETGVLFLRCWDGDHFDIFISFDYRNLMGRPEARFNNDAPELLLLNDSYDRRALYIRTPDKMEFAHKLLTSQRLRISLPVYTHGPPVMLDFTLKGSSGPIGQVMDACGLKSPSV